MASKIQGTLRFPLFSLFPPLPLINPLPSYLSYYPINSLRSYVPDGVFDLSPCSYLN